MPYQNPTSNINDILSGTIYSLLGLGGFKAERGLQDISMNPLTKISSYDVTNSVQVLFDVRTINTKLGITKNADNSAVIDPQVIYDATTGKIATDVFVITARDFITGVTNSNQVLSVGRLSTLYSEFNTYLSSYFTIGNGFNTLFDLSNNNGSLYTVFDASGFIQIMNGSTRNNIGQYTLDLSGSITVNNINEILDYLVYQNPFNNRNGESVAIDNSPYVKQGFIEGDLLFVPNGISVTLNVNINNNNIHLNYVGQTGQNTLDSNSNYSNGYFSSNLSHTETNIKKVVTVPLLIKLVNRS
jgi:hypothetical protein